MADWIRFDLSKYTIGEKPLQGVQNVVNTAVSLAQASISVLELLQTFLTSIGNPISAIVKTLLNELQTIIDNLESSGVYGLYLVPDTIEELIEYKGGYDTFEQKFVESLHDTEDPNRPQIGPTGAMGGLVLYFNQGTYAEYLRQLLAMLSFFARRTNIKFPAPINIQATPATENGIKKSVIEGVFESKADLNSLVLEWEEPKFQQDVFYDIFSSNKFYIEKSKSREGKLVTRDKTREALKDPLQRKREKENRENKIKEPVLGPDGQPKRYWEPLDTNNPQESFIDPTQEDVIGNFIAGSYKVLLGPDQVDKGIENAYYYRVQSVPKDTTVVEEEFPKQGGGTQTIWQLKRNNGTYLDSEPSTPVLGAIPKIDGDSFDMPQALLNTYRAAYQLRFDAEIQEPDGILQGSDSIEPRLPEKITSLDEELGGVTSQGQAGFRERGVKPFDYRFFTGPLFEDEIPGYFDTKTHVKIKGKLTETSTAEDDPFSGASEMFAEKFGQSPREKYRTFIDKQAIEKIETILPVILENDSLYEIVENAYKGAEDEILSLLTEEVSGGDFLNEQTRDDISAIIRLVNGHANQGQPPNWESLTLLGDIFPEIGDFLSRFFNLLKSIDNFTNNVLGELGDTLEGVQDRLRRLTEIINFLNEIIEFIESLSVDFQGGLLLVPPQTGGVSKFTQAILDAKNKPETDKDDISGGIVLAFGGPTGTGMFDAIKFLFGL